VARDELGRVEGLRPFHDVSVGEATLRLRRKCGAPLMLAGRRYVVEKTRPGALERQIRPHDPPRAFSVMHNANSKILC
jgi:hypothetical protein